MTEVSGFGLPAVSAEFIKTMELAFPTPVLEPGFDRDKALWAAAQHAVVDWVITKSNQRQAVTADPVSRQLARVRERPDR